MLKKYIFAVALVAVVSLAGVGVVNAETTGNTALKAQIEILLKKIAELQAQLKATQGEVDDLIKAGLSEGMTDESIKEIQQLLATDPEIYPSGLTTGYFGPMTREAIKRFQTKFELEVTGTLNEETRQALSEVRKERKEAGPPVGLLRVVEVRERIKNRLMEKWENCDYVRPGKEAYCKNKKDNRNEKNKVEAEVVEKDDNNDKEVTRDEARKEVVDAQNELNKFRKGVKDGDTEAKILLREAQAEVSKARRALARGMFKDAYAAAEEALEILEDEEDEDESEDD